MSEAKPLTEEELRELGAEVPCRMTEAGWLRILATIDALTKERGTLHTEMKCRNELTARAISAEAERDRMMMELKAIEALAGDAGPSGLVEPMRIFNRIEIIARRALAAKGGKP